jgi:serine/threonine protein kinase
MAASAVGSSEYTCDKYTFRLLRTLGSGSTGDVYLAQPTSSKKHRKQSTELCALKIVRLHERAQSKQAQLRAEVLALKTLGRHPNIIGLQNYGFDSSTLTSFIQLSFASRGDLLSFIEKRPFTEAEAMPLIHNILSAMAHAHAKGICHRDMKLENVLLTESGSAVVADWGLSSQFSTSTPMTKDCGSLHYAAPEILSASPYYGHLVDSFSLGILFFAMITGCFPFFGNSPRERFLDIVTRKKIPFPAHISSPLRDLISRLLAVVPTARLTPAMALQHSWFDELRDRLSAASGTSSPSSIWMTAILPPVSSPECIRKPPSLMSKIKQKLTSSSPPSMPVIHSTLSDDPI